MGFHLRKTKKVGLFNFNLSNSGIGTSFGIKGLRVGVDGKGRAYVGGGKGVLRYRQYFTSNKTKEIVEPKKHGDNIFMDNKYKPKLTNSFKSKGLGYFITFLKGFFCTFLSFILISIFWSIGAAISKTHPIWACSFFIVGFFSIFFPWNYIYNPLFVKIANKATHFLKQNQFDAAVELYEQSKQIIQEAKFYIPTYYFEQWLNDNLYNCYMNLKNYEKAYNFIKQNNIISDRRSKFVGILIRLEKWEELTQFIQKEFTQQEKDENLFLYTIMAEAFLKLNQPQIAIDCLSQGPISARKMNDAMCDYRYTLAQCYEAIGDSQNAQKQYSKIYSYNTDYKDVKNKI